MKSLFFGILLIVVLGFGGLVYRNAVEHPAQQITCPLDALLCPDGTSVARTGNSCTFAVCPAPNVSLASITVSFALPEGFVTAAPSDFFDPTVVATYEVPAAGASIPDASIVIHRYPIAASSTALATIQQTAIGGTSGVPISPTRFSSTVLGSHRFTIVSIDRFEAVIDTAYYLARATDVLRFDAIDRSVMNWTDPTLDTSTLPAHVALIKLLSTLQGQ